MSFVTTFLMTFSALALGGVGALFAAFGGVAPLALEGVMLLGGLMGVLCSRLPIGLCLLLSGGAGAVYALLLGVAALGLKGDQALSGLAFSALAAAIAMTAARLVGGVSYSRKGFQLLLGGENVTIFLPLALAAALGGWLLLYHTSWGVRLRLCGHSAGAAKKAGVRTGGMGWLCLLLFGFLSGIGGTAGLVSLGGGWRMEWGLGGLSLLALSALAAGRFSLARLLALSAVLAFAQAGCAWLSGLGMNVPEGVWRMVPFGLALVFLALRGNRTGAPGEVLRSLSGGPMKTDGMEELW